MWDFVLSGDEVEEHESNKLTPAEIEEAKRWFYFGDMFPDWEKRRKILKARKHLGKNASGRAIKDHLRVLTDKELKAREERLVIVNQVLDLVKQGSKVVDACLACGKNYDAMRRWVEFEEVKDYFKNKNVPSKRQEVIDKVIELVKTGMTIKDACKKIGTFQATISHWPQYSQLAKYTRHNVNYEGAQKLLDQGYTAVAVAKILGLSESQVYNLKRRSKKNENR